MKQPDKNSTEKYNPTEVEAKWQEVWRRSKVYEPDRKRSKKPFYNLMMFPYPSAEGLHVGNMYAFTGSDIYGRFMRMQGFDVLEPIGLDGFGIHSENFALKINEHPNIVAKRTEANFYRQLRSIGNAYSWSTKLETYASNYYKWTQWIFIKLFKANLAYRSKSSVNWCPQCLTVLADEQVISKIKNQVSVCERCSSEVVKKELEQWFFRITNYAQKLLSGLKKIDWSEKVKIAQRNWIGKSEGIEIMFPCDIESNTYLNVFTTRPDTIYGATYMALAPEHPMVIKIIEKTKVLLRQKIQRYVADSNKKTEAERVGDINTKKEIVKTGIFTGFHSINPLSNVKVPIYIADYVLPGYGTGAIMGVPAHDQRDWEFAKKYRIDIVEVVSGGDISRSAFTDEGVLVNSQKFNGLSSKDAINKISTYMINKKVAKSKVMWHLRDWIISRQRYWGSPIPMIFCKSCASKGKSWFSSTEGEKSLKISNSAHEMHGWYPVPEEDLPVKLPYVKDFKPTGTGLSPLASEPSFVKVKCPQCKEEARRETDVSDTFLDSAWYFLRYPSINQELKGQEDKKTKLPWDQEITKKWLPVDMYIGGAEHSVLHLLYSRFITMVFNDLGLIEFREPFSRFRAHGLLISQGAKMSKSKGNIVNPDEYIEKYGADTLRTYLMFCGRFSQGGDFRDTGVEGMYRFLKRIWKLIGSNSELKTQNSELSSEAAHMMHKTIKKVTQDIESLSYNTMISTIMEWVNFLEEKGNNKQKTINRKQPIRFITREEVRTLLLLLASFAPHITEELWSRLSGKTKPDNLWSIHTHPWPKYDEKLTESSVIEVVVQVNGKLRGKLNVERDIEQTKVQKLALEIAGVLRHLGSRKPKKIVFVKNRLINFVV